MTNTMHCEVSARDFSRSTLKALSKMGVSIAYPQFMPGADGSYLSGFRTYALTNGRILTHSEVLAMVGK